jgi:hypothetical protein
MCDHNIDSIAFDGVIPRKLCHVYQYTNISKFEFLTAEYMLFIFFRVEL